jgi:hypothetical protein
MSDLKSTEEILLNRVNELNSTVKQLNTERQQLLNTIESQQQMNLIQLRSIALKDVEINNLKKLNNTVNTPVEQEVKSPVDTVIKTPEELHQSIVKKFSSIMTNIYGDGRGCLCAVDFKKLDNDEVKYLCDYFSVADVRNLADGSNGIKYWYEGDLDKFTRATSMVVMSANKLDTKAREFLKSVEGIDAKIDEVLINMNLVILDSIKKIKFTLSPYNTRGVQITYCTPLNKCQKEYYIKTVLSKEVHDFPLSNTSTVEMSFG